MGVGEQMEIIRIPSERLAVLFGKAGDTQKLLEGACKVLLSVDEDGAVQIEGEPVDEYFSKDVIRAIGRGFEPNIALLLLNEEYALRIVNLREMGNENWMLRQKGRVIGEKGRTRKIIEEMSESHISVYGYTISVIANLGTIDIAMEAVSMLLQGHTHPAVYAYLEKQKREMKKKRVLDFVG
jgi:ribosomal RNA assembly protein